MDRIGSRRVARYRPHWLTIFLILLNYVLVFLKYIIFIMYINITYISMYRKNYSSKEVKTFYNLKKGEYRYKFILIGLFMQSYTFL